MINSVAIFAHLGYGPDDAVDMAGDQNLEDGRDMVGVEVGEFFEQQVYPADSASAVIPLNVRDGPINPRPADHSPVILSKHVTNGMICYMTLEMIDYHRVVRRRNMFFYPSISTAESPTSASK